MADEQFKHLMSPFNPKYGLPKDGETIHFQTPPRFTSDIPAAYQSDGRILLQTADGFTHEKRVDPGYIGRVYLMPKLVAMDPNPLDKDSICVVEKREFFYRGRAQKTGLPLYVEENKPLPADFQRTIHDNLWHLYGNPIGPRPICESCRNGGVCGCYQPLWDSPKCVA